AVTLPVEQEVGGENAAAPSSIQQVRCRCLRRSLPRKSRIPLREGLFRHSQARLTSRLSAWDSNRTVSFVGTCMALHELDQYLQTEKGTDAKVVEIAAGWCAAKVWVGLGAAAAPCDDEEVQHIIPPGGGYGYSD